MAETKGIENENEIEGFTRDEKMIISDLIIVMAAIFEVSVGEVKETLQKLKNFDGLLMCLLCSHTLGIPLDEVVNKHDHPDFEGHMETAKSRYINREYN